MDISCVEMKANIFSPDRPSRSRIIRFIPETKDRERTFFHVYYIGTNYRVYSNKSLLQQYYNVYNRIYYERISNTNRNCVCRIRQQFSLGTYIKISYPYIPLLLLHLNTLLIRVFVYNNIIYITKFVII